MQFSNFSRLEVDLTITLYNEIPIENVGIIQYYSDNSQGIFSKKEFRWSPDSTYWSSWETLTIGAISRIDTHGNYYFFLEIRYVLTYANSGTVSTFTLNYLNGTATATRFENLNYNVTSSIDASTLNGYSGNWYLNRAHHNGYQPISSITGLQAALNEISIDYYDKNESDNLFYKKTFPPITTDSSGEMGTIAVDASYFYICVSTNSWGRILLDKNF
jgi:hypothetical protein